MQKVERVNCYSSALNDFHHYRNQIKLVFLTPLIFQQVRQWRQLLNTEFRLKLHVSEINNQSRTTSPAYMLLKTKSLQLTDRVYNRAVLSSLSYGGSPAVVLHFNYG